MTSFERLDRTALLDLSAPSVLTKNSDHFCRAMREAAMTKSLVIPTNSCPTLR